MRQRRLLASSGPVGVVAASVLGEACRPVRAVLFDKTTATNWSVAWHQDRTIAVMERVDVEGFGPWTVKSGLLHVAPPFDLLAGMLTLRVHLDPVPETNAPLLVARGSHRLGRIAQQRYTRSCGGAELLPVLPRLATFGSMRPRSCTPLRWLPPPPVAECCKSISQSAVSPADLNGLEL